MTLRLGPLMVGVLVVCCAFTAEASAQGSGAFTISPLVLPGQPTPNGGHFFPGRLYDGGITGSQAFNTAGVAGVSADTQSACSPGDFLMSEKGGVWIAGFCPQSPTGDLSYLGRMNINERGDAAFVGGPVNANDVIQNRLFLYSNGQVSVAAENGSPTVGAGSSLPLSNECYFSDPPSINNNGQVSFGACTVDGAGILHPGVFVASGGTVSAVVSDNDPTPAGGVFDFEEVYQWSATINDNGQILFQSLLYTTDTTIQSGFGLFVAGDGVVQKIVLNGDVIANAYNVAASAPPALPITGMINNNGDVAFCTTLEKSVGARSDSGIFLYSGNAIQKIVVQGDRSPIGGRFSTFNDSSLGTMVSYGLQQPELNLAGQVVFKAKAGPSGETSAIFMASPTAVVKIVGAGDLLPNGERIGEIDSYALNEAGQVAFFAYKKGGKLELGPLGVWVASPAAPVINSAKLVTKKGRVKLMVEGTAFITNDSVIEINGNPLGDMSYPAGFQQSGGTTTRLLSQDPQVSQLLQPGQTFQIEVVNRLTATTSSAFSFTP